jgi:multiple sugar transport system ATP-binding protein
MAEVTLEQVEKQYANGVHAVRDFNLTIRDGELLVLVGPSGCGKTTTLRLIAGLEEPTRGVLRMDGRTLNGVPPRDRDVGMVFQRHSLYPHLTVRQNLGFGLWLREGQDRLARLWDRCFRPARHAQLRQEEAKRETRIEEAARWLELETLLDRLPRQLSGGEQQRAALGRALVRQPAVLLMDEPLSHLDPRLRFELRRQLHLLHERLPATMIYVTHDQSEAMTLGERLVVLDQGTIQQVDRPAEIYARPRNRFVAGFIGWPPMNFLDGRLIEVQSQLAFQAADDFWPVPPERAKPWAALVGRDVTLGVRPEYIRPATDGEAGTLTMETALVEWLGSEALVTFQRKGLRLTARMEAPLGWTRGQTVCIRCDMRQSHLFDRSSGAALGMRGPDG